MLGFFLLMFWNLGYLPKNDKLYGDTVCQIPPQILVRKIYGQIGPRNIRLQY